MFNCPKCSSEVRYGARYCEHCGCEMNWDSVNNQANGTVSDWSGTEAKWSILAIAGFVSSLFGFSVISLVLSIIGRKECREKGLQGGGLALAGIIISAISIFLSVIGIIVAIAVPSIWSGYLHF